MFQRSASRGRHGPGFVLHATRRYAAFHAALCCMPLLPVLKRVREEF